MATEVQGPPVREHLALMTHQIWGTMGVWECAFYQLFSRETTARAADLFGKRRQHMDEMEREQQQQVEQNIAVRCLSDVATMMATMHVPPAVGTTLLDKLKELGMISATGKDVAAGIFEEQYQAEAHEREQKSGRERAWLEGRLQRALDAEQQAMDRVNSFKAQCKAMDEQCAEMEAREKATRAEIESQDQRWEEIVAHMQEEIKRLQQEARIRVSAAGAGTVPEFASPDIM